MASIQVPETDNEAVTVPSITATPAVSLVAGTPAPTLSDRQDTAMGKGSSDHQSAEKLTAAAEDDAEYPRGVKFILIMLVVAFDVFLVALDQTIVSTAVPQVTNEFNSFSDVGWYGSAYLLTSTAFQPLFGRLYASFGVKWIYLLAFCIFELGSLLCAVATSSAMFIVARAIAGLGMAGGYSGCLIIINLAAPLHIRPLLTSLVGVVYGIGGTIGPIIGGALTSEATWRWCFYLNLFCIPVVVPVIIFFLKVKHRPQTTSLTARLLAIDWLGTALILCSLICILLVFQWGGIKYAWSDSRIIGLIVGFFAIAVAFAVDQWYMGERATTPFRIFKQRTILGGSIVNFMVGATYFAELYFLPIYFQTIKGDSAIRSGVATLSFIISVIFSVSMTGGLVNKFGHYIPFLFLGTALMTIGAGTLYTLQPDTGLSQWVGLQFLAGFGPGMAFMLPFIASTAVLAPTDLELGSAVVIFWQTCGGTIAVSLAQSIFQNKFALYLPGIPGIDPAAILSKGVSAFRETTPPESLPAVVAAANQALGKVWLAIVVLGGVSFFSVFMMELDRKIDVEASKQGEVDKKANRAAAASKAGEADVEKASTEPLSGE